MMIHKIIDIASEHVLMWHVLVEIMGVKLTETSDQSTMTRIILRLVLCLVYCNA